MKDRAPNVYRWTERMNLAAISDGEFADQSAAYLADDEIPATLEPLLRLIFADWGPGLAADADCFNAWAVAQPPDQLVSVDGKRRVHPNLGPVEYRWRGITVRRASAPHGLFLFMKAADFARGLSGHAAARLSGLMQRTGGTEMVALALSRPMLRKDYALVVL
jgi:hypothetical protein